MRHFRRRVDSRNRATLLLGPLDEIGDQDVIGIVYNYRSDAGVQTVYYLSNSSQAVTAARRYWQLDEEGWRPKFRRLSGPVVEVQGPTPDQENRGGFILMLLGSLGLAIAL